MASRRIFLKGFAATLAVAAVPALPNDKRILRDGGVFEGRTFIFREGQPVIVPELTHVRFVRCHFIWRDVRPRHFVQVDAGGHGNFESCEFEMQLRYEVGMHDLPKNSRYLGVWDEASVPVPMVVSRWA